MESDNIIQGIEEIVNWWFQIPEDYNNLTELMYQRKQLSGFVYYFGTLMGSHKKQLKYSQAEYENKRAQQEVKFGIKNGTTKASRLSSANSSDERAQYYEEEAVQDLMKNQWYSLQKILDAMNQLIAFLRKEYERNQLFGIE